MSQLRPPYETHALPAILLVKNGRLVDAETYVRPLLEGRPGLGYTLDDLEPAHVPRAQELQFPNNYVRGQRYLGDVRRTLAERAHPPPNISERERLRHHYYGISERPPWHDQVPYSTEYPLPDVYDPYHLRRFGY